MNKGIVVEDEYDEQENDLNTFKIKRVSSLYDESVEVVGADDVQSPPPSGSLKRKTNLSGHGDFIEKGKMEDSLKNSQWQNKESGSMSNFSYNSEDDDEEDDDDDVRGPIIHGAYDPNDYDQLVVSEEIKDIFNYITKYTPQTIELENKLCPFLPDFIPAVGDIDAFIKVRRPDGKKEDLGLVVLDEPRTQQSDPAVLQLQLRAVAKQSSAKAVVVKKIEDAERNGKSIDRWIKAISDLHTTKPSPTVQYTKAMPNLDNLMQEWPSELEDKLSVTAIPHPDLDCDLSTYITIMCNLFDIPVRESKIEALHVFFSLYSTIKTTQGHLIHSQEKE